jgi:PAS domain S-box-containing protein
MKVNDVRVLIISDNPDLASMLCRALSQAENPRFLVEIFKTGSQGLQACAGDPQPEPRCAIVDAILPDMTGMDLIERLRRKTGEILLPVVMCLDCLPDQGTIRSALLAGAQECIDASTITADRLAVVVESALVRFELLEQQQLQSTGPDRKDRTLKSSVEWAETESVLRESALRFHCLSMSNCMGIFVGDMHGHLSEVNDEYLRLLGYSREAFESRPFRWTEITPPEWLQIDRQRLADARAGTTCAPYEKEYFRKDGARLPVLVGLAFLSDRDDRIVGFVLDLTERKRTEKALKDVDRRKNEFIAALAHELKNPLAAISTAVHILRIKGPDHPELTWGRDVIVRQVRQLTRLIDDLLDMSRITTGTIRLKQVDTDLRDVVSRAVEAIQPLIASREHELRMHLPSDPLPAIVDPTRIEQVIAHLVSNAAKFTECGGTITVSGFMDAENVVIRVRDSGVGISSQAIPSLFDLFAQSGPSHDRSQGGLGIGLPLVKSLVAMHGGTVSVISNGDGQGTEFTIHIPSSERGIVEMADPDEA